TLLVPFLAWFGTWLLGQVILKNPKSQLEAFFPETKKILSGVILVFVMVAGWVGWVQFYNGQHHSVNFLTHIYPIWDLPQTEISRIWDMIVHKRFTRIYPPIMLGGIFIWTLWVFVRPKRWGFPLNTFFVLLWMGASAVFLLFYFQFQHHDYYLLDLMYAPLATISFFLFEVSRVLKKSQWPDSFFNRIPGFRMFVLVILMGLCTLGVIYAKAHLDKVFATTHSDMQGFPANLYDKALALRNYNQSLGLHYTNTKVLALPDPSFNVTLYYLNLKGFTHPNVNLPEAKWQKIWEEGVRYVVVFNKNLVDHPDLKKYAGKQIGNFEGEVFFFELLQPTISGQ
ncbi:MAG: hypothetical protein KDC24_09425, partial [Saprospiraceae bacterium]|nr:hypothetical protein [Saprospiraceae bacterium]